MTEAERDERARLQACLARIEENQDRAMARLADYHEDVQASHDCMWEARRDMDHIDKISLPEDWTRREWTRYA